MDLLVLSRLICKNFSNYQKPVEARAESLAKSRSLAVWVSHLFQFWQRPEIHRLHAL